MSDKFNPKKALLLAGKKSDLVRQLTGGTSVYGDQVCACSVTELPSVLSRLKDIVDQYDIEILSGAQRSRE